MGCCISASDTSDDNEIDYTNYLGRDDFNDENENGYHYHNDNGKHFKKEYKVGEEIGSGAFSVVRKGSHRKTGEEYAIKIITKAKLKEDDEIALKQEIEILQDMHHENIMRLHDVYTEEPKYYYLVTENLEGGELFDRVVAKSYYNEKEARDACKVLYEAVRYIHEKKVAHRDLKPENLLLQNAYDDAKIKIGDFGFAKKCEEPKSLRTACGTPGYVAPEILEGKSYDMQVDIWSLGVIVYILLGGYPPFLENNQKELFKKIRAGDYVFHEEYWKAVSEEAKNMIRSMLTVDPDKRATSERILTDCPWMSEGDAALAGKDLGVNLQKFKEFNAKRKFKSLVDAVVAVNKFKSLGENFRDHL